MFKKGFTLAEVLITIGIIGIVAQMTIPAIMSSVDNQVTITSLKKFNSVFSEALKRYASDSNCAGDLKCTGALDGGTGTEAETKAASTKIGSELVKYLKVIKNCELNGNDLDDGTNCLPRRTYCLNDTWASNFNLIPDAYKFVTIDGMAIYIRVFTSNCESNVGTGGLSSTCGETLVDINGVKQPNKLGRDTFLFYISSNGTLYPWGVHVFKNSFMYWDGSDANSRCSTSQTSAGFGCAGRIFEEGWKINY